MCRSPARTTWGDAHWLAHNVAMRTTLMIDDDVLDVVRAIASAEGRSMGSVITDLTRRALAPANLTYRDGIPVFEVSASAPPFGSGEVMRAVSDE